MSTLQRTCSWTQEKSKYKVCSVGDKLQLLKTWKRQIMYHMVVTTASFFGQCHNVILSPPFTKSSYRSLDPGWNMKIFSQCNQCLFIHFFHCWPFLHLYEKPYPPYKDLSLMVNSKREYHVMSSPDDIKGTEVSIWVENDKMSKNLGRKSHWIKFNSETQYTLLV